MPPSAVRTSAPSTTAARQLPSVPPWPHQTTEPSGQRGRRRQGIRSRVERELCCAAPPGDVEQSERPHLESRRTVGRDALKRACRQLDMIVGQLVEQRVPRRPAPRRCADYGASWKKLEKMHEVEKQTRRWMSPNELALPVLSEGVDGFRALHAVRRPVPRQQGRGG